MRQPDGPITKSNKKSLFMTTRSKRIVLATLGSFGDLHPYIALGMGLKARGHDVAVASSEFYRPKVESAGLEFAPIPPDLPDLGDEIELTRKITDQATGSEFVVRDLITPFTESGYEHLSVACRNADLLVSHPLTLAAPLYGEKTGIPWVSSVLAPLSLFSVYDPPIYPQMPALAYFRWMGSWFFRLMMKVARRKINTWMQPVRDLRKKLGLPPSDKCPLIEGQYSPFGTLAMFSPVLGGPQRDWPVNTCQTGFPFYDRLDHHAGLAPEIEQFLAGGSPPIVFTLGSSAVMDARTFFEESYHAAKALKRRAIFLIGRDQRNVLKSALTSDMLAAEYAPYSELFPRAAAVVHQGGVGTTGQGLAAGVPTIIMPFAHDQPDNAFRAQRLGVSRTIARKQYTAAKATKELAILLGDPSYAERAKAIGKIVAAEDGVTKASVFLESILAGVAQ